MHRVTFLSSHRINLFIYVLICLNEHSLITSAYIVFRDVVACSTYIGEYGQSWYVFLQILTCSFISVNARTFTVTLLSYPGCHGVGADLFVSILSILVFGTLLFWACFRWSVSPSVWIEGSIFVCLRVYLELDSCIVIALFLFAVNFLFYLYFLFPLCL